VKLESIEGEVGKKIKEMESSGKVSDQHAMVLR
jgi:hypothetical protein